MKKFTILVIFSHLLLAFMALGLTLASCEVPSNEAPPSTTPGNNEGETTYTVRFDPNGGSGTAPDTVTVNAGSRITLPDGDGLSKSGYDFDGWNTRANGTGTDYAEGSSFTPTGNVTLYAQWNPVVDTDTVRELTVEMWDRAGDGWDGSGALRISVNGSELPTNARLNSGEGPGYYYFSVNAGDTITFYWIAGSAQSENAFAVYYRDNPPSPAFNPAQNATVDTERILLYRQYYDMSDMVDGTELGIFSVYTTVNSVTVSFDANGGSGTPPSAQTVQAGSSITLPGGDGLTKSGYSFDGWNTEADGTGTNHSADSSYTVQNDITLYAFWIIVPEDSFTVTFDSNGGSNVDMGIVQSGGTATRPADPVRNGYTFDNWYSNAGLTTVYNFSTPVTGNIILYAKWIATQTVSPDRIEYYWVDQHGNLVTTSGGTTTVAAGRTLTITAQDASYVGRQWHLNGKDTGQSGNTYTFSSTTIGKHTVGLFVEKDGRLYNTNITITVQ